MDNQRRRRADRPILAEPDDGRKPPPNDSSPSGTVVNQVRTPIRFESCAAASEDGDKEIRSCTSLEPTKVIFRGSAQTNPSSWRTTPAVPFARNGWHHQQTRIGLLHVGAVLQPFTSAICERYWQLRSEMPDWVVGCQGDSRLRHHF